MTQRPPAGDQPPTPPQQPTLSISEDHRSAIFRGALWCGGGILIGLISLVLCCFSLGANFQNEGWGSVSAQSATGRQIPFIVSLVGFGVAIPLFWIGFFRLTHPHPRANEEPTIH